MAFFQSFYIFVDILPYLESSWASNYNYQFGYFFCQFCRFLFPVLWSSVAGLIYVLWTGLFISM